MSLLGSGTLCCSLNRVTVIHPDHPRADRDRPDRADSMAPRRRHRSRQTVDRHWQGRNESATSTTQAAVSLICRKTGLMASAETPKSPPARPRPRARRRTADPVREVGLILTRTSICLRMRRGPELQRLLQPGGRSRSAIGRGERDRRKQLVWEIERKLAEDGTRPIIFYSRGGPAGSLTSKG